MTFSDMSWLVTLPMSEPQYNLLTVLTVPCIFLARGNDHLRMYHRDCSISNEVKITEETVDMLPWSLVLQLWRVVSAASVTFAGKLAT